MTATATRQDSILYTHKLPNGLQMIGQFLPGVQSVASVFWVVTGTRDEDPAQMGISHFLEHMAFKRTATMTGQDIDHAFEEMGAEHNAATWKEMTFYWARVLGENRERCLHVLAELTHPVLDAQDFDAERNVILEEIARYDDMPSHVLLDHFMHDYFGDHPLAWETLGTPETIRALTVDQMRDYWNRRYGTQNILFAIAGNFDWESVKGQVAALTSGWTEGDRGRSLSPAPFTSRFDVYKHDKFVQEQIAIGVPSVANSDPRYFTAAVLSTILGDDTGSRLFWSIYHEGLAESVSASVMDFDDNGLLLIHIGTEPEKAQQALTVAEAELQRLQNFDVEQAELDRAKAKLNSSVIIGGESTNDRVLGLINSWLTLGKLETLEEIREKIDAVTLDDLRHYLEAFPVWPRQVVTAVGPLEPEQLQNPVE